MCLILIVILIKINVIFVINNTSMTTTTSSNTNADKISFNLTKKILKISRPSLKEVTFRNKYWQVLSEKVDVKMHRKKHEEMNEVAAYSSFYDLRTGNASVRVLVVKKGVSKELPVFCQLWFGEEENG